MAGRFGFFRTTLALALAANTITVRADAQNEQEAAGPLALQEAIDFVGRLNPGLTAAAHDVLAAESAARQAGVRPNPEIEIEAEDFGGTDSREGYDGATTTAGISQRIELGGKRSKRQSVARAEARLTGWDYEASRLDILTRTKQAFVDVLAAQCRVALAAEALALAEDVRKAAAERVKAGKVPELEAIKAAVEVSSAGIARDRTKRELDVARRLLVANWGSATPRFTNAVGSLDDVGDAASLDSLAAAVERSPEVARWTDARLAAAESLRLAKAQRVPDITVNVGVRRFDEDGTHAAVAGVALPLPLFDRNAGGIAAAQHCVAAAEQKERAARLLAATSLAEIHGRFDTARSEAVAIRDGLIPAAQKAFDAAQTGYRQGKFGLLEVLDAQRTLNDAKAGHLEALTAYHKAAADMERLTGTPLTATEQTNEQEVK
ncbi:MAG: TolC family protein [Lentisphaerae bacterium]|nr:TolC family protein [Lentisphaerota bacterium]